MVTVKAGYLGTLSPRTVEQAKKEKTLARRRFQRGQLLLMQQTWSMRFYEDVIIENGERKRLRVQRPLGTLTEYPTKRLAMRAMEAALSTVNSLAYRPRTTATFRDFALRWMEDCKTRKRKPIKPSTLSNWQNILDNHVLPALGSTPLSETNNTAMKALVTILVRKKLSAQTIKNITLTVKLVKASAVDEDGGELFPTKWNHKFIDMPIVDETKQRKPSFSAEQVEGIVKAARGRMQMAAVLFAATGMRAGELLGLEVRHFDGASVKVEQEVWYDKVQEPKTPNAKRVIDLHPDVASLLAQFIGDRKDGFVFRTSSGKPLSQTNLLRRELHPILKTLEIEKRGFHSFRRFRNTFLRNSHCPDGLLKFWMGHAAKDMTDRYDRVREDVEFRKDVARSMGVGFEIPKALSPKLPKTSKPKRSKAGEAIVSGVIGRQLETAVEVSP